MGYALLAHWCVCYRMPHVTGSCSDGAVAVEHGAHFQREIVLAEGLLQQIGLLVGPAHLEVDAIGVARHEQHF